MKPSATTIEIERHQHRHEAGHDRAEDEQQDDERHREPELELPFPEIVLRELVEVAVGRPLAGDPHDEAAAVGALDRVDDVLDVRLGVADQADGDQRGMAVRREQIAAPLLVRVVRDDGVLPPDRLGEVDHLRSEGGVVRREARRMDDDQLVDLLVRVERDPRADQLVGLLGLRVVRDLALGRQVADEGRGQRDPDEDRRRPTRRGHATDGARSSS